MRLDLRYAAVCTGLGLVLGWIPSFLHGPIAAKFAVLHIDGSAVWAWHLARCLIGVYVALLPLPAAWYLRGPLCGFFTLLPLTLVSLAMPGCRLPCMCWNLLTGSMIGLSVAGLAFAITGRSRGYD